MSTTPPSPFGPNLRRALEKREMTQEALARQIDVSLSAVNGWVSGNRMPRWTQIVRIADVLDRDPAWFYVEREEQPA